MSSKDNYEKRTTAEMFLFGYLVVLIIVGLMLQFYNYFGG